MNKSERIRVADTPKRRLSPEEVAAALGAKRMTPGEFHEWWLGQHEGAPLTRLERAVIDAAMGLWSQKPNELSWVNWHARLWDACAALAAERSKG